MMVLPWSLLYLKCGNGNSNSKQIDFTKAITKWRMYDVVSTILKLQQYRLELLNSLLIIIYAMNV